MAEGERYTIGDAVVEVGAVVYDGGRATLDQRRVVGGGDGLGFLRVSGVISRDASALHKTLAGAAEYRRRLLDRRIKRARETIAEAEAEMAGLTKILGERAAALPDSGTVGGVKDRAGDEGQVRRAEVED